ARTIRDNGFVDGHDGATVTIEYPIDTTANHTTDPDVLANPENYIYVRIESQKPSYFIQVLYPEPLRVSADAISFCRRSNATAAIPNSVLDQYAFRSLASPGQCTSSPAWDISGTGWTVDGDIWVPNARGNVEFSSNQPNPETRDNRADVLGDIYLGDPSTFNFNSQLNANKLNEDISTSAVLATNGRDAWISSGGDGTLDFSYPEPADLPYDMAYFRPGGTLQSLFPGDYHDLSAYCDHSGVTPQDYADNGAPLRGVHYNGSTWEPGIYYATCNIALNRDGMKGYGVSFITEGRIDVSGGNNFDFEAHDGAPLFVSNYQSSTNSSNCSGGSYAIQLNGTNHHYQGNIIAFNGYVAIQGNGMLLESCVSARGFKHNGNEGAIYRCVPSTTAPVENAEFGVSE
ncbi:MAG: hypothetical protein AAFV93_00175, partial [Chloroflexota bacterium]